MGWNEWPLMFFTVISQTAVGAFWFCALTLFFGFGLNTEQKRALQQNTLIIWLLMALAFGISSLHVGMPTRGINVLIRVGQAPLSNESLFGGLFTGLGFVYWFLCWRHIGGDWLRKLLLAALLICSIGFFWFVCQFYLIPTVPTWNTPLTPIAFVLTAMICGSALAWLLFLLSKIDRQGRHFFLRLATLGVFGAALVTITQASMLPNIQSAIHKASELSPDYSCLMIYRFVLLGAGLLLWWQLSRSHSRSALMQAICLILLMTGEWIGRGVFYALHMTVGLI